MKLSEIYKKAQIAVLESNLKTDVCLEVLKVLIKEEEHAIWCEEQKEKKEGITND